MIVILFLLYPLVKNLYSCFLFSILERPHTGFETKPSPTLSCRGITGHFRNSTSADDHPIFSVPISLMCSANQLTGFHRVGILTLTRLIPNLSNCNNN